MRIKPRDIEVPEYDPFKCDLLRRREAVEALTNLVGNLEGPCALAVDAPWGAGKTTFLRIWAQHLRKEGFPVIEFNAWKSDFSENPFVVLSTEIMRGLKSSDGKGSKQEKYDSFKNSAEDVLRRIGPDVVRSTASFVPIIGPSTGEILGSLADEMLSRHKDTEKVVENFTNDLTAAAESLSLAHEKRSLILMIDELDRCRPSYSVDLLEMAKHLFSVDHIVFVLAINRSQLAHSVKALYGVDFDAEGYLRRFFDVDFQLPEPKREAFIDAQLRATGIEKFFDLKLTEPKRDYGFFIPKDKRTDAGEQLCEMLSAYSGASDFSLRTIGQMIHRLGLVYASLPIGRIDFALATAVALVLRTVDSSLYHRFNRGEATDREVVKTVFDHHDRKALQYGKYGELFEATLVLASLEGKNVELPKSGLRIPESLKTPLLDYYRNFDRTFRELDDGEDVEPAQRTADEHAKRVLRQIEDLIRYNLDQGQIGYREAVRRIELLSGHDEEAQSSVSSESDSSKPATKSGRFNRA